MKAAERQKLRARVTRVVSQVILQTSGKSIEPDPEQPLFDGMLDPLELTHLVLALQHEFDVTLKRYEVNERTLGTVEKITAVLVRRL